MVARHALNVFQPTRPLRGATVCLRCHRLDTSFQPTRPLRGATVRLTNYSNYHKNISTHAPLAGRDSSTQLIQLPFEISTHAPLAGRDYHHLAKHNHLRKFQPTRPLRGATLTRPHATNSETISTHAPLAGRDYITIIRMSCQEISTHAPLAGRDQKTAEDILRPIYFNPRAPCGARQLRNFLCKSQRRISTHAPLAGRD